MSILKKNQKLLLSILLVASIPITVPLIADFTRILLQAGRIIGTMIRIY